MKKILCVAVLALDLLAQDVLAQCCAPPCPPCRKPGFQLNWCCCGCSLNVFCGGGQTQLGPWYQYWPYEAYFQQPPPLGPATAGPGYMGYAPQFSTAFAAPCAAPPMTAWSTPMPTYQAQGTPMPTYPAQASPMVQNVGYNYGPAAPSYWYGR